MEFRAQVPFHGLWRPTFFGKEGLGYVCPDETGVPF